MRNRPSARMAFLAQLTPAAAVLVGAYFDGRWGWAATTAAWGAALTIVVAVIRYWYPEWWARPPVRTQAATLVRVGADRIVSRLEPPQ
ncbi:MAG: hypothetical protein M3170_04715 [Candidatus Dormibacteraeota bacterium]|nr:hypothetical protein [Candidatus Dormibacteraeota bacterium]